MKKVYYRGSDERPSIKYNLSSNPDGSVRLTDAKGNKIINNDVGSIIIEQFDNRVYVSFLNSNNVVVRQHRKTL